MRLGATAAQIGIGLGWLAATMLVARAFYHGGIEGLLITGLFCWGSLAAMLAFQDLSDRCDRYERLLRKHGIDLLDSYM